MTSSLAPEFRELWHLIDELRSQVLEHRTLDKGHVPIDRRLLWRLITSFDAAKSAAFPLVNLPNELIHHISSFLHTRDISSFLLANRDLSTILTPYLYRRLAKERSHSQLLYNAIKLSGKLATIERLAQAGVDINTVFEHRRRMGHTSETTALKMASGLHLEPIVRYLLKSSLEDRPTTISQSRTEVDDDDATAAAASEEEWHTDQSDADELSDAEVGLFAALSPLDMSKCTRTRGALAPTITALLEAAACPNTRCTYSGRTAVHLAASLEDSADASTALEILISYGGDPTAKDDDLRTPLHQARTSAAVSSLVAAGADLDFVDKKSYTPLLSAAERDAVDAVKALVEAGANVNFATGGGVTALMLAASISRSNLFSRNKQNAEIVQFLLERGARVTKDMTWQTPIMHAVRPPRWSFAHAPLEKGVIELLMRAGDDINAVDLMGHTALEIALRKVSELDQGELKAGLMALGAKPGSEVETPAEREKRIVKLKIIYTEEQLSIRDIRL